MNIFNRLDIIILAKLLPSEYREYWKIWNEKFRNRYDDIFGNKIYRLYFPVENVTVEDFSLKLPAYMVNFNLFLKYNTDNDLLNVNNFINSVLSLKTENGIKFRSWEEIEKYIEENTPKNESNKPVKITNFIFYVKNEILPYLKQFKESSKKNINSGYVENNKNQKIRIIKFIEKLKYLISIADNIDIKIKDVFNASLDEGIKLYDTYSKELVDKKKNDQEYEIVISRHPYDVAGMSTDRGWRSCMELPNKKKPKGGQFYKYVEADIEYGTLVCYFIKKEDHNIEHPMGRISIKPYLKEILSTEIADIFDDYFVPKYKDDLNKIHDNIINIYNTMFDLFNNQEKYIKLDKTDLKVSIRYNQIIFEFKNSKTKKSMHIYLDILTSLYNELYEIYQIKRNTPNDPNDKTHSKLKYLQKINDVLNLIGKVYNDTAHLQELFSKKIIETKEEYSKDKFLVIEKAKYGIFPTKAIKLIENWLNETINKGMSGIYIKNENLYDDGSPKEIDASKPQESDDIKQSGWDVENE